MANENGSTEMAGVLLSLQSSLKQLVQAAKAQTEAFNNLREDILLQRDPNEEDKEVITDGTPHCPFWPRQLEASYETARERSSNLILTHFTLDCVRKKSADNQVVWRWFIQTS